MKLVYGFIAEFANKTNLSNLLRVKKTSWFRVVWQCQEEKTYQTQKPHIVCFFLQNKNKTKQKTQDFGALTKAPNKYGLAQNVL